MYMKDLVDGLFIRSLLLSFFFKVFPEIIQEGRLLISEPPLYRVDDKKNPFIINKDDYVQRYIASVVKDYNIGWYRGKKEPEFFNLKNKEEMNQLKEFLSASSSYVDDIILLSKHYKVNDRLMEMIIEEFGFNYMENQTASSMINSINVQQMMNRIGEEFKELYYDDNNKIIKGVIDGKYQSLEISERMVRKSVELVEIIRMYGPRPGLPVVLRNTKTFTDESVSLLGLLKILKKYQPNILHRFKGLGENDDSDIKTTVMDPNTRTLIRVQIGVLQNDMEIFHVLRGTSPNDARGRKEMMRNFKIDRNDIDT